MQVRLIPYSDVFVSMTLSLDEATALLDGLEVASKHMPDSVRAVNDKLWQELEAALGRAAVIQQKRDV